MEQISAAVPIKLNNERLPGKNTKELCGKPLLHYVQELLLSEPWLSGRYIFCSSEEVGKYLLPGITYLERPAYLDEPTSNFSQIFEEFMARVPADVYVYAHATAPYIEKSTLRDCLDAVLSGEYDSAFCASKIQDYLWCKGAPLNFDAANLPQSQDLTPIYRETSGVYVFRREIFEETHCRVGRKSLIKEVTFREAVDINTQQDFELAEALARLPQKHQKE